MSISPNRDSGTARVATSCCSTGAGARHEPSRTPYLESPSKFSATLAVRFRLLGQSHRASLEPGSRIRSDPGPGNPGLESPTPPQLSHGDSVHSPRVLAQRARSAWVSARQLALFKVATTLPKKCTTGTARWLAPGVPGDARSPDFLCRCFTSGPDPPLDDRHGSWNACPRPVPPRIAAGSRPRAGRSQSGARSVRRCLPM